MLNRILAKCLSTAIFVPFLNGCSFFQSISLRRVPSSEEVCSKDIKYQISARYKEQVHQCYEHLLSRNPAARGTVDLELIVVYGTVVDVRFDQSSTLKGKKVRTCIRKSAMEWRFTDQCEDLSVQYSFPLLVASE